MNNSAPAISAVNLNKIEQGIKDACDGVDELDVKISSLFESVANETAVTVDGSGMTVYDVPYATGKGLGDVVGVVQVNVGNNNLIVKGWALIDNTGLRVYVKNIASSQQTGTLYTRVIYVK